MSRAEHPGSIGGWAGVLTEYDIVGRVKRQSVPTEVDAGWTPAGDDAVRVCRGAGDDASGRTG